MSSKEAVGGPKSSPLDTAHQAASCHEEEQHYILLVEDDAVTLKHVEAMLKTYGNYHVRTAVNGRVALEMLEEARREQGRLPDLILTDLRMPEVSGFDLIQAVQDVPIVVMSSHDSQENVMQAFEAGAKDYLIKPIRRNEVSTLWQHIWRNGKVKPKSPTCTNNASNGQAIASGSGASSDSASPKEKEGVQHDSVTSDDKGHHPHPQPFPTLPRNTSTLSAVHLDMPAKPLEDSASLRTEGHECGPAAAQDMVTEAMEPKSKPKPPPSHLANHSAFTAFTVFLPQDQKKSQEAAEEPVVAQECASVLPPVLPLIDITLKPSDPTPSHPQPSQTPMSSSNSAPPMVPLLGLPPMFQQYMLPPSVMQLLYTFQSNPNGIPYSTNPEISGLCFPVSGMNLNPPNPNPNPNTKPNPNNLTRVKSSPLPVSANKTHASKVSELGIKSPGSGGGSHMLCGGKPINGSAIRQAAVARYLLKRKNRSFGKKVRYESRKKLADSRPRVKGMFVKRDPNQVQQKGVEVANEESVDGSRGSRDAAEALTLMDKAEVEVEVEDEDEEMEEEDDEP